jgi:hypothetical protein
MSRTDLLFWLSLFLACRALRRGRLGIHRAVTGNAGAPAHIAAAPHLSAFAALVCGDQAFAAQTYRCWTLPKSVMTAWLSALRGNDREFWLRSGYKSFVIDARSGAVKVGDLDARDWVIEQTKVDGAWDFVAKASRAIQCSRRTVPAMWPLRSTATCCSGDCSMCSSSENLSTRPPCMDMRNAI